MKQWEQLTERLGFWIHLDEAYVTYHQSYVESVWWSLKTAVRSRAAVPGAQDRLVVGAGRHGAEFGRGRTRLSRSRGSRASTCVFRCVDEENTSLLVWTTTPWTLPNNQFAAVHPELDYVTVRDEQSGERLVLAAALCRDDRRQGQTHVHCRRDAPGQPAAGETLSAAVRLLLCPGWRSAGTAARRRTRLHRLARGGGRLCDGRQRHGRRASGAGLRRSGLRSVAGRTGAVRGAAKVRR